MFCQTNLQSAGKITYRNNNSEGNAKSVLSVLGACIKKGDEIEILCDGEDEKDALKTMIEIVESGLGE